MRAGNQHGESRKPGPTFFYKCQSYPSLDPLHSPRPPLLTSSKGQLLLLLGLGQASTAAIDVALPSKEGGHVPLSGELSPGQE